MKQKVKCYVLLERTRRANGNGWCKWVPIGCYAAKKATEDAAYQVRCFYKYAERPVDIRFVPIALEVE